MKVFVYPPPYGFGMATLFNAVKARMPAHGVTWELAPTVAAVPPPDADLAQLFSLPELYTSFQNLLTARRAHLRVVATALYWNPTRYQLEGIPLSEPPASPADAERNAALRKAVLAVEQSLARAIYRACDVLIAQSTSEADALVDDFGVARERIVVAWCGTEARYAHADPTLFQEKFGLRHFILSVGRVDANKNQLSLIRALREESLPLVLAGGSQAPGYLERCKALDGANVHFLPMLSDAELASAYAAAQVHALASWLEVVGLVTLEAAVAGCNVVLSREHGARDYIGDAGWYCDPGDVDSIRRAVLDAYHAPRQTALSEKLLNTFTWEKHAEAECEAYARARSLPPLDETDARAHLEEATYALVTLVPRLQASRDALWREKSELAETLRAYQNGRVMRILNTIQRIVKR